MDLTGKLMIVFVLLLIGGSSVYFIMQLANQNSGQVKQSNDQDISPVQTGQLGSKDNISIISNTTNEAEPQQVSVIALGTGTYDKTQITVKKGIPVNFSFTAERSSGCGKALYIPEFNIRLVSGNGETKSAVFTPEKAGKFVYRCGMDMFHGELIVVD
jgi:hypothetical protein